MAGLDRIGSCAFFICSNHQMSQWAPMEPAAPGLPNPSDSLPPASSEIFGGWRAWRALDLT
jgi:hypothetical protein